MWSALASPRSWRHCGYGRWGGGGEGGACSETEGGGGGERGREREREESGETERIEWRGMRGGGGGV